MTRDTLIATVAAEIRRLGFTGNNASTEIANHGSAIYVSTRSAHNWKGRKEWSHPNIGFKVYCIMSADSVVKAVRDHFAKYDYLIKEANA